MKRKKRKKVAIWIGICLLIIFYFGVKAFFLYDYTTHRITEDSFVWELKEIFDNRKTVTIKRNLSDREDYFSFEELRMKNVFEEQKEPGKTYKIKDSDSTVTLVRTPIDDLVTLVKKESKNTGLFYDLSEDLAQNSVDTNYKLYSYLFNNLPPKLNIFSSINHFRKAHSVDLATTLALSSFHSFTVLEGDYDGYILQNNKANIITLTHGEYSYTITIYNSTYSEEQVYTLLSTIDFV